MKRKIPFNKKDTIQMVLTPDKFIQEKQKVAERKLQERAVAAAEKSNNIACQALAESKKANKLSKRSNVISIIAIIISIAVGVFTVVDIILRICGQ